MPELSIMTCLHERRHLIVYMGSLPNGALFRLEAEGRERAIIRAALGNATGKEIRRMRKQIGSHEGPIRVAANRNLSGVNHALSCCFLHTPDRCSIACKVQTSSSLDGPRSLDTTGALHPA